MLLHEIYADLLKFLLHSTTRARIEEEVFVFCLTVYPDIYVIACWKSKKVKKKKNEKKRSIHGVRNAPASLRRFLEIHARCNI